jgi:glycosyltransferase involved in cell wall biosynthesis
MQLLSPKNIVFVCDFDNIHSRNYISYFASQPDLYSVTVISSAPARAMDHVTILPLQSPQEINPRKVITKGVVGKLVYNVMQKLPTILVRLRMREYLYQIQKYQKNILAFVPMIQPDIIHAFRMQPEVIVASSLKKAFPKVPFVVTTWGQDFVLFTRQGGALHRLCQQSLEHVDLLLPDNERDESLAKKEFKLNQHALCKVMPATGGLNLGELEHIQEAVINLKGKINLLSMRGYENSYIRVQVLIKAFGQFVKKYPEAHLYIDANIRIQDATRDAMILRWIQHEQLERSVTLLHLNRTELFQYMKACDMYVSATISDGLPMSLVEALFWGMIPVVVDHESTRKIVAETHGSVVYQNIEPDTIFHAWEKALKYLHDRADRTKYNQQVLKEKYEREENLRQVEDLYERLVSKATP